jgi:transcriptional regulator with XRE-family HTH domain
MAKYGNFFRQNVEILLAKEGISQKALAEKMGLSGASLSKTLTNSSPTYETLERFGTHFKVPPFYLLMSPEDRKAWDAKSPNSQHSQQARPSPQGEISYFEMIVRKAAALTPPQAQAVLLTIDGLTNQTLDQLLEGPADHEDSDQEPQTRPKRKSR